MYRLTSSDALASCRATSSLACCRILAAYRFSIFSCPPVRCCWWDVWCVRCGAPPGAEEEEGGEGEGTTDASTCLCVVWMHECVDVLPTGTILP